MQSVSAGQVREDVEHAPLGDARLRARGGLIADGLARHPQLGLPRIFTDPSQLEAAYRFVNNRRVTMDLLLQGHVLGVGERMAGAVEALAVHDSTTFEFGGEAPREGFGIDNGGRGFSAHCTLMLSADGSRTVFGVGQIEPLFRFVRRKATMTARERRNAPDKESLRWARGVNAVEEAFSKAADLIHVMDAEADFYDLLEHLARQEHRFVVRLTQERILLDERGRRLASTPRELLLREPAVAEREVVLSPRSDKTKAGRKKAPHGLKTNKPRKRRVARLEIAARSTSIARPERSPASDEAIHVNLVHVREVDTPDGEEPIEWLLATTEPVDTEAEILRVVDIYRDRWAIEEFFKALKTGCAYEKRQFESKHALLNILALLAPIACTLLGLRAAIEQRPGSESVPLLTLQQQRILRAALKLRSKRDVLPAVLTNADMALGIAMLGGYPNKSRPPGWQTLGRGYEELLAMEAGYVLAQETA